MIFSTNALSLLAAVSLFGGATFGMAVDIEGVVDDSKTTHSHGNFRGGLQNPHKPLQFPVHQSLTETKTAAAAKLPHTSFSPGLGNECHKALDNKDLSLDFACNSLMMPQGWQKSNTDGSYDLAIVGGGIGASYLAYRLQESFSANNEKLPKIALFERTERLGGRLVSEYGPGALGLSVIPRDGAEASSALPLQEYGGMRIDPYRYPLVFNTAVKIGKELSSALDLKCETVQEAGAEAECPLMFVRMNVENVRFSTTSKDLGPLLANATYNTVTTNEYCPQDIKTGSGSPFDKCIQLVVAANEYFEGKDTGSISFKDGMEEACGGCDKVPGFCELCKQFPKPAEAVQACSGYDQPVTRPFNFITGLVEEVIDVHRTTHLHLFRGGFQRFAQSLMMSTDAVEFSVSAPQFHRTVDGIAVKDDGIDEDVSALAQMQVERIMGSESEDYDPNTLNSTSSTPIKSKTIELQFSDGTSVKAKNAFLNMLPFDLPAIRGLEPWSAALDRYADPGLATKIVLGWNDKTKAPPAMLKITPCVNSEGKGCERLIFSGDNKDGWMIRQFWLWDEFTIMIYTVGANSDAENVYPADTLQTIAKEQGMNILIEKIMKQLHDVTGVQIEDPDWARIQPWTSGNLVFGKSGQKFENFGYAIHRPLGLETPLFYGNSEANPDANLHGWVEGVFEMVEQNLPTIAKSVGLKGNIVPPDRSGKRSTGEILMMHGDHCKKKAEQQDKNIEINVW